VLVVGGEDVAGGTVGVNRRGWPKPEKDVPLSAFLDEVRDEVARRDRQDMERALAPLVKPEGAVVVDTTGRGIAEVVDTLLRIVEQARCCTRS